MHTQKGNIPQRLLNTAKFVCLMVLCLTSIGIISAKYASEGSGNAGTSAAQFSPSFVSDSMIDISDIQKPGDSTDKAFKVQNFSGDSVSEVTMTYTITLKTTGNLPLRYTVLDNKGNVLAEDWICDGISGNQRYECKDSSFIFTPGVAGIHEYTLKIEWPSSQKAAHFSGKTDAVYLSVIWEQVD